MVGCRRIAHWYGAIGGLRLKVDADVLDSHEAAALAAFIQAGPPKKRWRITRTFEERPADVGFNKGSSATQLTDADIEEVWEDEEADRG